LPLPKDITRKDIVKIIPARIAEYNKETPYNSIYRHFITERKERIKSSGSLEKWLITPEAGNLIHLFIKNYSTKPYIVSLPEVCARKLYELTRTVDIEGLSKFTPEQGPLVKKIGNSTVAQGLGKLFDFCSHWRCFSEAGGILIGSKVAHAIFPELCPIIEPKHIGISLFNLAPGEYLPPGDSWNTYLGYTPRRKINPSPRGGGRCRWRRDQYLCAVGFYARIYQDWQEANDTPGLDAFLSLDPKQSTTGIPRLLEKVFW